MVRLLLFLAGVALAAAGLHWLADRPGSLVVDWQGYLIETSVFRALILLAVLIVVAVVAWSLVRQVWRGPATVGSYINRRRERQGLAALSNGLIAIGSGDVSRAATAALGARKALPNEPLTQLLRAQTAQLSGDRATARRIFEAMLGAPDTEELGLRGLFLEAEREGETGAARQFAERALRRNPRLGWPVEALFEQQCRDGDWAAALETVAVGRRNGSVPKPIADRRRAVLLTAQAQTAEDTRPDEALALALEAHGLAPDLVPAAAIAGRILGSRGQTARAARVLLKTWRLAPHPELAAAYNYARSGDSPLDRLERARQLERLVPHDSEGRLTLAQAAADARQWDEARDALAPLLGERVTQRVCTLMARIESEQSRNAGRVREWLARAVNAPRDPAWTADGVVSEHWAPVSPVTGAIDAFQWRVPLSALDPLQGARLADKIEEFVELGAGSETLLEHGRKAPEDDLEPAEAVREPERIDTVAVVEEASPEAPRAQSPTPAAQTVDPPSARRNDPPDERARRNASADAGKAMEPRVFVAPRPPDDPGAPEDFEAGDDALPVAPRFVR
ncbi:MAG: heme biosynthesis protein HemY [Hyphomicrobiaceae bacterium]